MPEELLIEEMQLKEESVQQLSVFSLEDFFETKLVINVWKIKDNHSINIIKLYLQIFS